jgi:cytochrome c biogenesis protein CcmG/thiol:disulfide interchange protein DsbE
VRAWAAAGALLSTALAAAPAPGPAGSIPVDPPLTAQDPATGESVALDPRGGPMHLVVMATWCRPCLAQVPALFDLEDRYRPDGYRLFLIAVPTRQSAQRLERFAAESPVPGHLLLDATGTVTAALGATTIPTNILVDRTGRIVARSETPGPDFAREVARLVAEEGRGTP